MKQKRKVKSLISQKMEWSESLLTTLLLILSVILCIGSASLMTTSVGAADDDQHFEFAYTGLDNKSEVLYRMNFIDPNNLSNVRNTMYMSGKTLYIAPYPVMVNPKNPGTNEISTARNEIIGTEKSNILGGDNNKINYSDNITIIAGDGNVIRSGYSNSVVIGGKDNSLNSGVYNNYKQMNSVFVGGDNNRADNYGNATLIGGNNNKIYSNNSFILGGSDNQIDNPNSIVGGKNVKAELYSNRFAFSYRGSDNFEPKGPNAFYLNLENGVGLGVDGSRGGLAVSGAVYFGEIDIRTIRCNTGANIGLKGSYSGCLVGCTKGGFDDGGKWEMLDRGEKCTEICNDNSSYCTNKTEELVPVDNYVAFCTTGVVNISNAVLCYSGEIENYNNVVFETSLIDSNENCMDFGTENKCLYKCKEGFHLTGDIAGGGHGTRTGCYQDCILPWNEYETIKHNETVIGYKNENVSCAYDEDTPHSPDTCNNYKATLVCSGGTLYVANANGTASNKTASDEGYKYRHCLLNGYECSTWKYDLSEEDVKQGETRQGYTEPSLNSFNWRGKDRQTIGGTRGNYKLCIDFDANPEDPAIDGTKCDEKVPHFKLLNCKAGFATGYGYENECRRTCISPIDGTVVKDGEKIGGYINGNFVCPHSCDDEIILICHDGQWKDENGNTVNTVSSTCSVSDEVCEGYNVDYTTYEIYNNESGENPTSIYEPCTKYRSSPDHQHCTEGETVYKLVDCVDGYHMEEGYNYCISDERAGLCSSYVSIPKHHAHRKYAGGIFNREWDGNSRVMNPEDACDWECDDGYDKETTDQEGGYVCVSKPECGSNPNECKGDNPTSTGQTNDGKGNYYWTCIGNYEGDNIGYSNNGEGGETYTYGGTGLEVSCHACSSSYTWDGLNNRCIKKENGTCLATHYNCKSMDGYATGIVNSKSSAHEDKYTWDCKANYATGITANCQECRYNLTGADCHPLTQQVDCPSDKPDHSYWRIGTDGGTYTQIWTKGTTRDYWDHGYWSPNYTTDYVSQYTPSYNECSFTCMWYNGYKYNSSTKKCVKCTLSVPANAEPNNNYLPDDDTDYHFSNNKNEPCSFSCIDYHTWKNGNCEPNEYACTNKPTGSGYKFGSGMYSYGDTLTEWTYTDNSTPGTCQFTCDTDAGYTWSGGVCTLPACNWTITYNPNEGSSTPAPVTETCGNPITLSAGISRDGCEFAGWISSENGQPYTAGQNYSRITNATEITMTAAWSCTCANTLTLKPNGGKVTFGGSTATTTSASMTKNCNDTTNIPTPWKDTLTGQVVYTITYDSDGGSAVSPQYATKTTTTGYTYAGWTSTGTCGTMNGTTYTFPSGNGTICTKTAVWSTGTSTSTTSLTLRSAPTKTNCTFSGWKNSTNGITYPAGKTGYVPTGNTTMVAQWTCTTPVCENTLTVDPNGGKVTIDSTTYTSSTNFKRACNSTITVPNATNKADTTSTSNCTVKFYENKGGSTYTSKTATKTTVTSYAFSGWDDSNVCGGWNPTTHKYTYPLSYGTTCTKKASWKVSGTSTTTGSLSVPSVSRTDHEFLGWYNASNGGSKVINTGVSSYTPNLCGQSLYAHRGDICENTLTVNPNGGKVTIDSTTYTSSTNFKRACNSTLTVPNPTKANTSTTSDCIVNFYKNKGTSETPITRNALTTSATMWSFNGWTNTNENTCGIMNGTTYTFPGSYNTICTKTANWKVNSTTTTTQEINDVPSVSRTDHVFLGWYTAADGGDLVIDVGVSTYVPNACGQNLYAHRRGVKYGVCENSEKYKCMDSTDTIETVNVGNDFYGWKWYCISVDGKSSPLCQKCSTYEKDSCEDPHDYQNIPAGEWNEENCSCLCPQNATFDGQDGCVCDPGYIFDGQEQCSECDTSKQQGCQNPQGGVVGTRNAYTCSCSCPYNSHRSTQYNECVCDTENDYYWNGSKCEKNYSINNGTVDIGDKYYLCNGNGYFVSADTILNLPHSASQACMYEDDCFGDYIEGVDGDTQYFSCTYRGVIQKCTTSDYTNYCSSHPGRFCYIEESDYECQQGQAYVASAICNTAACTGAPNNPGWVEIETCSEKVSYVQCK